MILNVFKKVISRNRHRKVTAYRFSRQKHKKTPIITIVHKFKKVKESTKMMEREMIDL